MVTLLAPASPAKVVKGGYANITLGWGLAVLMASASPAGQRRLTFTPAVTLALAVFAASPGARSPLRAGPGRRRLRRRCPGLRQLLPAFQVFDPALEKTAGVFHHLPHFPDAWGYGLLDQVVRHPALLVGLILAITEPRNRAVPAGLQAAGDRSWWSCHRRFLGGMHGYAINPARDLARAVHGGGGVPQHRLRQSRLVGPSPGPGRGPARGASCMTWSSAPFVRQARRVNQDRLRRYRRRDPGPVVAVLGDEGRCAAVSW